MTTLRSAAERALEALEHHGGHLPWNAFVEVRKDLREALEQPAQSAEIKNQWVLRDVYFDEDGEPTMHRAPEQEPVAWMVYTLDGKSVCVTDNPADFTDEHRVLPLYTSQPQRKPLTAPQIHELDWPDGVAFEDILEFTRAIERAHGIGR